MLMKKRSLLYEKTAISIMHDTLLFLVFLSISAMIISPAVLHSNSYDSQTDYLRENHVQEVLQTLLSTSVHQFSYRTGSNFYDPIAEQIGLDTQLNHSFYSLISNHVLGKQQYHKTIAQLLTEQLVNQYRITMNNETFRLNPFSIDSYHQIYDILSARLHELIPSYYHYNFTAQWQPIPSIPFGGKISLGNPVPELVSSYSSHQTLSVPFLPCILINHSKYCFSSYHLKQNLNKYINETDSLKNITFLQQYTTTENKSFLLKENISTFLEHIFITGFYTKNYQLLFPSILDVLFHFLFSTASHSFTDHYHSLPSFTSFTPLTTLMKSFESSIEIPDITTFILLQLKQTINIFFDQFSWSCLNDVISFLKQNISQLIQPFIHTLSEDLCFLFTTHQSFKTCITEIIEVVFSYLSLSTASVTLSIWRG